MRQKMQTLVIILLAALLVNSFAYANEESEGNNVTIDGVLMKRGSISDGTVSDGTVSGGTVSDNDTVSSGTVSDNDTVSGSTVSGGTVSGDTVSGDTVSGDTVSGDTVSGDTVSGGTVSGDTVSGDTVSGGTVSGDTTSDGTVSDNTVSDNIASDGTVSDNTASGGTVSDNTVSDNIASGNTVSGDTASGGAVSDNTASGGTVSDNDTVSDNTVSDNTVSGDTASGGTVSDDTVSDGSVSGADQSVSGGVTVLQNPNALQVAAFSMKVPKALNFIMDPYEISGKGSVWSQDYGFENRGSTAVKLYMRRLHAKAREGVFVGKDMELTGKGDKDIALWFRMSNGDNVPITEGFTSYEIVLEPGESLIFQVAGKMSVNERWESGDLSISMIYQVEAVAKKE